MRLIAVDPGADLGVAVFNEQKQLVWADCFPGEQMTRIDHVCMTWGISTAVIEYPMIYPQSKAEPNRIIKLAFCAGVVNGVLARHTSEVHLVTPRSWKGTCPKEVHQKRILAKLGPPEIEVVNSIKCPSGKKHNVIDAIGLGLWQVGRKA